MYVDSLLLDDYVLDLLRLYRGGFEQAHGDLLRVLQYVNLRYWAVDANQFSGQ
jgi:hypothetical protein